MKQIELRQLIFLALCCDLGLFSKRLIAPVANAITDALHIPGGIGTSFSLMFLVVAAALLRFPGCAALMGVLQSILALAFGMAGNMGLLSPLGYIVPGIVIDLVLLCVRLVKLNLSLALVLANMLGASSASLIANAIVFRLRGFPLALYVLVALTSGAICGILSAYLAKRLIPIINFERRRSKV